MTDLLVPAHVNALVVERPMRVAGPPSDYEILPWFDGKQDRNGTVANIAAAINAEPFSDHQFWLQLGVHLHWTLPDGLKRGSNRQSAARAVKVGDLWLPPAPNRWLVLRESALLESGPAAPSRAWLIESDYVHPGTARPTEPAIAYPRPVKRGKPPFLYLGRKVALNPDDMTPLAKAVKPIGPATSLVSIAAPLTALGPGDPLFAAHYPSCHSVFGLHDPDPAPADVSTTYSVYGWYSDGVTDPLAAAVATLKHDRDRMTALLANNAHDADNPPDATLPGRELTPDEIGTAVFLHLRQTFGWGVFGLPRDVPTSILCHARVTVKDGPAVVEPVQGAGPVGVGSSPAEALAALLAPTHGLDAASEDRLVQALAATDLSAHPLDLGQKLKEARHNEQFRAEPGHAVWVIRPDEDAVDGTRAGERQTFPPDLAHELNALNVLQEQYDRRQTAIRGLKQELFSDWHHYMRAVYPEVDDEPFAVDVGALRDLIEATRLAPLEAMIAETGQLFLGEGPGGNMLVTDRLPDATDSPDVFTADTLANRIVRQHRVVLAALRPRKAEPSGLHIGLAPGPRYWRPNDPVIVLDDPHVRTRDHHGHKGQHVAAGKDTTAEHSVAYAFNVPGGWNRSGTAFAGNTRAPGDVRATHFHSNNFGWKVTYDPSGWDPLQLEWEVEIRPLARGGNAATGAYNLDIVTASQMLHPGRPDFTPVPNRQTMAETYKYLAGRSTLNPSMGRLLQKRLKGLPADLAATIGTPQGTPMVLPLGGFHDLLLMHHQDRQIEIDDPIGLPGQRAFAARIRDALGDFHPATPLPDAPFHPIRSGELHIHRLRVFDGFGRARDWTPASIRTSARMRVPGRALNKALLPLRLSQAARLNFRWLSAAHDDVEVNVHPATSPIVGWLLTNEIDGAIDIYDGAGQLLGSVGDSGWVPAPGGDLAPRSWRDITDRNLARVVRWLVAGGGNFTGNFIETLDRALETVDPEAATRQQPRGVLMGRPLALVRARLDLALAQHAALDQSLRALRHRMAQGGGDSHAFGDVRIPVRLGEHGQLNDGLCGYWIEGRFGFEGDVFHAPHGLNAGTPHDRIRVLNTGTLNDFPLELTVAGAPVTVSMLVEPHGSVHATTGILPTKSIAIPPDQFHDQLGALRITFKSAPILTPRGSVEIPLPSEPGFAWSWLERDGDVWRETPHHPTVRKPDFVLAFGPFGPALWELLVTEGRLVLADSPDAAILMPGDPAAKPDRYGAIGLTPEGVERGLHDLADAIADSEQRALYRPRPIARDGWLELRPTPEPKPALGSGLVVTTVDWEETS